MALRIGDLIEWQEKLWMVRKVDPSTETAFIESQDKEQHILGTESDCPVVCTPTLDWPAVSLPPRNGRLVSISRAPRGVGLSGPTELRWLLDWSKIDEFQMGGSLYLNPNLGLQYGDRIIIRITTIKKTVLSLPVDIPRDFYPLGRKRKVVESQQEREQQQRRISSDLYDHLLDDEDSF